MKRLWSYIITAIISFAGVLAPAQNALAAENVSAATNANNFYFENAEFDYYLEKASDGTSKMHVKETFEAVFPETNQNHGITRYIPYMNQDGRNLIVENQSALIFSVTRNGEREKFEIEKESGYYFVKIGNSARYVHGAQTYVLEYDFTNVVTAFDEQASLTTGDGVFQELYWNTNGTGWSQKFNKLTARVHLPAGIAEKMIAGTSCYVGRYGTSGQSRCAISSDDETTYNSLAANSESGKNAETVVAFEAESLSAGENLTFAIDFDAGTFAVKGPRKSYILFVYLAVQVVLTALAALWIGISYAKHVSEKRKLSKSLFVKPEYAPIKGMTVAEAGELYMKSTKSARVATLIEMAIKKNVEIIKEDKKGLLKNKNTWKVKVNKTDDLTEAEKDILKILNGGPMPANGETVVVEKHRASGTLERINNDFPKAAERLLKEKGLFETKVSGTMPYFVSVFLLVAVYIAVMVPIVNGAEGVILAGMGPIMAISAIVLVISCIVFSLLGTSAYKYIKRTEEGIREAKNLEGLKLYITMAEKDRIKFLQSVKGVDTSDKGICKLYEKLLPYACIFGVEESWLEELNRYYEVSGYNGGWYSGTDLMTFTMFHSMMTTTSSTIVSSTSYSSSSSSGGGGGGFSGGGGGGGGGGGW